MSRFGRHRFWLDGSYDRDEVEDCEYHPDHQWTQIRVGDVYPDSRWPDERMAICKGCFVPRCGESEADGCDLPRHHPEDHVTPHGETWPLGGTRPTQQSEGSTETRRLRITRYDSTSRIVARHGCVTEEEAVALLRLAVGHPFGGFVGGKLIEQADPMKIIHLPPPPGAEVGHTLIVDLEPTDD